MIKTIVQKTTYLVYDNVSENFIDVEVSGDKVKILNEYGKNVFVFESDNSQEVVKRWRNVLELLDKALDVVERDRRIKKEII